MAEISDLLGKTIVKIVKYDDESIKFITSDSGSILLHHEQDCCENVYIADITGDLQDLIGSPILMAEEAISYDPNPAYGDTRWTFYKLATINGYIDIRFNGESSGSYSVSVDISAIDKDSKKEIALTRLKEDYTEEVWE